MPTISIELTDSQYLAMEYVNDTPESWSSHAVTDRARIAIEEIVSIYTTKALDDGVSIPATREEIVIDAFARGWVQKSKDVSDSGAPE